MLLSLYCIILRVDLRSLSTWEALSMMGDVRTAHLACNLGLAREGLCHLEKCLASPARHWINSSEGHWRINAAKHHSRIALCVWSDLHLIQTLSAALSRLWILLNRIILILWKKKLSEPTNCPSQQTLKTNSSIWRADFLLQLRKQQRWLLVTSNVQTILVVSSLGLVWRFTCRSLSCYFLVLPYVSLSIFFPFSILLQSISLLISLAAIILSCWKLKTDFHVELEDCNSTRLDRTDRKSSHCNLRNAHPEEILKNQYL